LQLKIDIPDFSELRPEGMVPDAPGLQQRRSAETKLMILNAAIDSLADWGYSDTTTQLIAKRANISRGAMLHHYSTKQELISAVIDFAFFRHMEAFSQAIRSLTDEQRAGKNVGIQIEWESYNSREFKAYLELNNAARTDDELRSIFIDRAQRHDRYWREELIANFPEWAEKPEILDKARRFTQAVMTGMVINRAVWDDVDLEKTLLAFLANLLLMVREGKIEFPAIG
jgi:AcrR family transcriptional regulator